MKAINHATTTTYSLFLPLPFRPVGKLIPQDQTHRNPKEGETDKQEEEGEEKEEVRRKSETRVEREREVRDSLALTNLLAEKRYGKG